MNNFFCSAKLRKRVGKLSSFQCIFNDQLGKNLSHKYSMTFNYLDLPYICITDMSTFMELEPVVIKRVRHEDCKCRHIYFYCKVKSICKRSSWTTWCIMEMDPIIFLFFKNVFGKVHIPQLHASV